METYAKRFDVVEARDEHQALGRVHNTVMCDGGRTVEHGPSAWREILLLLVDRLAGRYGDGFVETETGAIVTIRFVVGQNGYKEFRLLPVGGQDPSQRLAELDDGHIYQQNILVDILFLKFNKQYTR